MGIFDKKNVEKANEEAGKKKGNPIKEPDIYTATLVKGEVKLSKTNNDMIVLTFSFEDYNDILSYFVFNKDKPEQALKISGVMKPAFDYDFLPVDAMTSKEEAQEVLKQIEPFFGKQLQAAVTVKEDLFEKFEENKKIVIKFTKPELWYFGAVGQKMSINKKKAFTKLTPEKQIIWDNYVLANPHKFKKNVEKFETTEEAEKFQQQELEKEQKKKEQAERTAPGHDTPEDDLPFILVPFIGLGTLLHLLF